MRFAVGVMGAMALFGCTEKDKPQPITPTVASASATPAALAALPRDGKDPRSCDFQVPEQSCIPGTDQDNWGCRSECAKTCDECAKPCKDAPCQDRCLKGRDDCNTKCVQYVADRQKERASNYGCKDRKSRPLDICKRAVACHQKCNFDDEKCKKGCIATFAPGCSASVTDYIEQDNCFPLDDSP